MSATAFVANLACWIFLAAVLALLMGEIGAAMRLAAGAAALGVEATARLAKIENPSP